MMEQQSNLEVEILDEPGRASGAILSLGGEIDLATVAVLAEAFEKLAERKLTDVVIDASQVSFMDSTGLHALVAGKGLIHAAGSRIALVASPQVRRVLELIFPDPLFAARVDTLAEARAALDWEV